METIYKHEELGIEIAKEDNEYIVIYGYGEEKDKDYYGGYSTIEEAFKCIEELLERRATV